MSRIALLFLLSLYGAATAAQPQRIVSMNLCTDELLLLLVERDRIASLSYFAGNPDFSSLAAEAQGIPANRGQAEEVLAHAPDLILTSQFSATLAANLLERLGHPVERLGFAATREEVFAQIRQVAALTGTDANGEQMIASLQDAIATERQALRARLEGRSAVFYSANGYTYGGASLQDDFLQSLGLRNLAAEAGLQGPAPLPLEILIAGAPDFLLTDRRSALDDQLAHPLLRHPALAALATRTRVLEIPDVWFQCAGPRLAEAYRGFARQLADVQ